MTNVEFECLDSIADAMCDMIVAEAGRNILPDREIMQAMNYLDLLICKYPEYESETSNV